MKKTFFQVHLHLHLQHIQRNNRVCHHPQYPHTQYSGTRYSVLECLQLYLYYKYIITSVPNCKELHLFYTIFLVFFYLFVINVIGIFRNRQWICWLQLGKTDAEVGVTSISFGHKKDLGTKKFWAQKVSGTKKFWAQKSLGTHASCTWEGYKVLIG